MCSTTLLIVYNVDCHSYIDSCIVADFFFCNSATQHIEWIYLRSKTVFSHQCVCGCHIDRHLDDVCVIADYTLTSSMISNTKIITKVKYKHSLVIYCHKFSSILIVVTILNIQSHYC